MQHLHWAFAIPLIAFLAVDAELAGGGAPALQKLFNGKDLTGWKFRTDNGSTKGDNNWSIVGSVSLDPKESTRFLTADGKGILIYSDAGKRVDLLLDMTHGDCQLHVEFNVAKDSQSAIYFHGRYRLQIGDSFGKSEAELKNGGCGFINDRAPAINASLAAGEWQVFDVHFQAPRFDNAGKKIANAKFIKVIHNGKVIHENVEVIDSASDSLRGPERPQGILMLQGGRGSVAFRNIAMKSLERSSPK